MAIKYMISADFGQTFDYTAVAVTERRLVPVGERYQHSYVEYDGPRSRGRKIHEVRHDVEQHYDLIRLDRVALRTPYTTIARGLVKLLNQLHAEHTKADDYSGDERVTVGLASTRGASARPCETSSKKRSGRASRRAARASTSCP